jgi:alpha-tubulin suppressor-like RCC1 family protein
MAEHSIALKDTGMVYTWGENLGGQLGDGTIINRWTPVEVSGM